MFGGIDGCAEPILDADLRVQPPHVPAYRFTADKQPMRDLSILVPLTDEVKNLVLPETQFLQALGHQKIVYKFGEYPAADPQLPGGDGTDRLPEDVVRASALQETNASGAQDALDCLPNRLLPHHSHLYSPVDLHIPDHLPPTHAFHRILR